MRVCRTCVMDEIVKEFEPRGEKCNFCEGYVEKAKKAIRPMDIHALPFKDCLLGISGGLDSSYAAKKMYDAGYRPVILVVDNGWDTEASANNVKVLLDYMKGCEVVTASLKTDIYREAQLAFLRSGTINCEIVSDHALIAILYHEAVKRGIRYIVHGGNVVTEGIMPESWGYDAKDWKYIKAIYERHGNRELFIDDLPHMNLWDWLDYTFIKRIKWFPILNHIGYDPTQATRELQAIGWHRYGYKHMENIYTRWFQGYVLPTRWGIDKRKAHFSTEIYAGTMNRELALELLRKPYYPEEQAEKDMAKIAGWFGIPEEELSFMIHIGGKRSHKVYPNNESLFRSLRVFVELARRVAVGV